MSEKAAIYAVDVKAETIPWATFKKSCCLKLFSDSQYQAPTPSEIATLIEKQKWSHQDVANIVGAQFDESKGRGSTTVRNWLRDPGNQGHRKITYSAWRLLLINAGLVNL